jgi:hypothetical protein
MLRAIGIASAVLLLLTGCSSRPVSIDEEAYQGQLAAAVTPIAPGGAGLSPAERARVQARLVAALDAQGVFATVIPLSTPGESNEAEVIIDPTVLDARRGAGGLERVTLQVRARRKSSGEVGVNGRYKGRSRAGRDAVADAAGALANDLSRRYGTRPVY